MFDPNDKYVKNLIEKYKSFFKMALHQQKGSSLSTDQIKAIGKRVLIELIEKAMDNQHVHVKDRPEIIMAFEELIRTECPEMLLESYQIFDENGLHDKH